MAKSTSTNSSEGTFSKTTLRNGVRVLTEVLPWMRSAAVGVWVDVGSRHELSGENGLSHFIEHLVFKGTLKRNAKEIAASLERLGGSLNAFTGKENTCFVARVLNAHLPEAVDVLTDLASTPTFTPTNIKREKGVVCEEIKEAFDTPSDRIHDIFSNTFWDSNPLGQTILGSQDNINSMTRKRVVDFYKHHYRTEGILVAASGAVSHRRLVSLVKEKLDLQQGSLQPLSKPDYIGKPRIKIEETDNLQTHLCVGFPGLPYVTKYRAAALVMHVLLGGGMSSILFQKIREEKGLAYSVYTFHDFHRDAGVFGAYLGTDKIHVKHAYEMVLAEMRKIKKRKLSAARIEDAKAQLKGHFIIGMESTSGRMSRIARRELMGGDFATIKQTLQVIDRIKPEDVLHAANLLIDEDKMATTILGPVDSGSFGHGA